MMFLKLCLGDSPIQLIIFCSSNEGVFLHFYAVQFNTLEQYFSSSYDDV